MEILAYVGLRWGELVALRRSRVDLLRRRIEVAESATEIGATLSWGTPKNHEPRTVTMPSTVVDKPAIHLGTGPSRGTRFHGAARWPAQVVDVATQCVAACHQRGRHRLATRS